MIIQNINFFKRKISIIYVYTYNFNENFITVTIHNLYALTQYEERADEHKVSV